VVELAEDITGWGRYLNARREYFEIDVFFSIIKEMKKT
jgi:hypothetical protein